MFSQVAFCLIIRKNWWAYQLKDCTCWTREAHEDAFEIFSNRVVQNYSKKDAGTALHRNAEESNLIYAMPICVAMFKHNIELNGHEMFLVFYMLPCGSYTSWPTVPPPWLPPQICPPLNLNSSGKHWCRLLRMNKHFQWSGYYSLETVSLWNIKWWEVG